MDTQNAVSFEIYDTGIGISEENLESLFKLFGKVMQKNKSINGVYCLKSDELRCSDKPGFEAWCIKSKKYCSNAVVNKDCPKTCGRCH